MGDEGAMNFSDDTIEYFLITLFEKIETIRNDTAYQSPKVWGIPMQTEIRALEFWRSVICECLASFCYVFIVCGAGISAGPGASIASVLFATALATGLSICTLTQCFGHVSGAHINPAVTIAMLITKKVTFIRSLMYVIAQCGGGIAGTAFLYGITIPGYQTNLSTSIWERFGVELVLTFIVVLTYLITMNTYTKWLTNSSLTIGAAYSACTFVSMPYLNPARSLGPSFVLSKWENHWVYWVAPLLGGIIAGITYEYIFNPHRRKRSKEVTEGDSSSIPSDEDPYDDLEKPPGTKYNANFNYRQTGQPIVTSSSGYCPSLMTASLYSAPLCKLERVESLYGGTKSLYCKSPPLTRANLNRSQSVYTKSNTGTTARDTLPRPGPLVPAQSLYSMRINQQQNHLQNQNVQNQMQQRSESTFAMRGVATTSRADGYAGASLKNHISDENHDDDGKASRSNRPESMYGSTSYPRHTQSDESNYSYYSSTKRSNASSVSYHNGSAGGKPVCINSTYGVRVPDGKPQLLPPVPATSSFHHPIPPHSPNAQY